MTIFWIVFSGMFGLVVGSFLNVCIDRLPAKKSLAYPPSHCDACQHPLEIWDLIPVVSYIWLRGKCRYCGARIPQRLPWVELVTGILFAFLFWRYGLDYKFFLIALYSCILLVLAFIDLQHKLILNVIIYPAAVIALIVGFFLPEFDIYKGVLGGAVGFAILMLPALVSRTGMGWGDVKMAGLIGLMTGYPRVFVGLFLGILSGGLIAIMLLVLKKRSRKDAIPFGPFLALGAFAALIYGQEILNWYLALFT
ncbi:MAG TPA: prepilin peptidase [Dehalococcoidales bacterium]